MKGIRGTTILIMFILFGLNNVNGIYYQVSSSLVAVTSNCAQFPSNVHDCSCDGDDLHTFPIVTLTDPSFINSQVKTVYNENPSSELLFNIWQPPKIH